MYLNKKFGFLLLFGMIMIVFPARSVAQSCGGNGQRACTVFERIPSCNSGLIERAGKCVKPPSPPQLQCGKKNQRPCLVTERIPSCNAGLVEDFSINKCVEKLNCGTEGQRPCLVTERIPSCDQGLMEDFSRNSCVKPEAVSEEELNKIGDQIFGKYRQEMEQLEDLLDELARAGEILEDSGEFTRLMVEEEYEELGRRLNIEGIRQSIMARQSGTSDGCGFQQETNFFDRIKSVTIGITADGAIGAGLIGEWGLVFTVNPNVERKGLWTYSSFGYKGGVALGVSGGVAAGAWLYEPNELCGAAQAFTVGAGYYVGGIFAGWLPIFEEWWLYKDASGLPLYGLQVTVSVALEVDVSLLRTNTIVKNTNGYQDCSPCGGRGERPCSIYERVPSCGGGMIEKWGKCLNPNDDIPGAMTPRQ